MGEIIIKVPEDVHEVIDLGLPYKKIKEKLKEIEREEKYDKALDFILNNRGILDKHFKITDEELHLQGD